MRVIEDVRSVLKAAWRTLRTVTNWPSCFFPSSLNISRQILLTMERDLSLNGGYECNCSCNDGCNYCVLGRQYLTYLSSVSEDPAFANSLQQEYFPSADVQAQSLLSASYGASPETVLPNSFHPACVPSSGFQSTNLLPTNTFSADFSFADFSSGHLPLPNGLPNTTADSAAPEESMLPVPTLDALLTVDVLPPSVSADFQGPAIMVESVTFSRSNTYTCPDCQVSLKKKSSLTRHIIS